MTRTVLPFLLCAVIAMNAAAAPAATGLPTVPLTINGHKLVVEVARTTEETSTGLMHRFSLKPDHGMLFARDRAEAQAFWMKNTFIPLSIAFVAPDGRIVNIDDMAPQDETLHWSRGPAMYAIEMRKGWFAEKGIGPGVVVRGIPVKKS